MSANSTIQKQSVPKHLAETKPVIKGTQNIVDTVTNAEEERLYKHDESNKECKMMVDETTNLKEEIKVLKEKLKETTAKLLEVSQKFKSSEVKHKVRVKELETYDSQYKELGIMFPKIIERVKELEL